MCRLQAVAIRTKDLEILESIIRAVAIYVIELHRDSSVFCALGPSTPFAAALFEPLGKQAVLKLEAWVRALNHENLVHAVFVSTKATLALVPSSSFEVVSADPVRLKIWLQCGVVSARLPQT